MKLAGAIFLLLAACGPSSRSAEGASTPKASASSSTTALTNVACKIGAVIEDGEDANNQLKKLEGRSGYIYTFGDDAKTVIFPPRGADFPMERGGALGSAYSLRVRGKVGDKGLVYGGLGLNFVDPRRPYDASKYAGITFLARRAPSTAAVIRLKLPDANTDPDGKVCTECFNDFGADVTLTEAWERYVIPFDYLKQLPDWGAPRPSKVDTKRIYSIQFQVSEPSAAFDFYIDDLMFAGCP
jgi:endoglucanase